MNKKENNIEKTQVFTIPRIIGIIILILVVYCIVAKYPAIFGEIFYDTDGNFNVSGIAAVSGVILTTSFSYRNNKKTLQQQKQQNEENIKASLVSKSIIDWLQNARKITSDFLSSALNCTSNYALAADKLYNGYLSFNLGHEEYSNALLNEGDKYRERGDSEREELLKQLFLFKLLFGKNDENNYLTNAAQEIVTIIYKIIDELNELTLRMTQSGIADEDLLKNIKLRVSYTECLVDYFTENCRIYFKREWDKAKKRNDKSDPITFIKLEKTTNREQLEIIQRYKKLSNK